jgi:hypothetical protein
MTRLMVLFMVTLLMGMPVFAMRSPPTSTAQTPADPEALLRQTIDAINRGDVDGLLTYFTDDSVITGAPDCVTPCVGLDGIRREFEAVAAVQVRVTLVDVQVNGSSASSRFEATSSFLTQAGFERIAGSFTIELRGDKIASSRFELDATDAETARFLSMYPGVTTAGPAPRTGPTVLPDAGGGPPGGGWTALAAALAVFGLVAVVGGLGAGRSRRGRSPR